MSDNEIPEKRPDESTSSKRITLQSMIEEFESWQNWVFAPEEDNFDNCSKGRYELERYQNFVIKLDRMLSLGKPKDTEMAYGIIRMKMGGHYVVPVEIADPPANLKDSTDDFFGALGIEYRLDDAMSLTDEDIRAYNATLRYR